MALLNYGKTLSQLVDLNYLKKPGESVHERKKYLELVFSSDGHIITHGRDYLARYNAEDYAKLSAEAKVEYLDSTLMSTKQIQDLINSGFAANDAMVFKGIINKADELPKTGYSAGWTYRIGTDGTYLGKYALAGDLIIAIADYSGTETNENWSIVDTDIKGTVGIKINGLGFELFGSQNDSVSTLNTIVAPTEYATYDNSLLVSNASAKPIWMKLSDISLDRFMFFTTKALSAENGTIKLTLGSLDITADASGTWNITAKIAEVAGKVNNPLTFDGSQFIVLLNNNVVTNGYFDGSLATKITLAPATTSTASNKHLGGVMVDPTYLTLLDGVISIDAELFASALGNVSAIASVLSAKDLEGGIQLLSKSGNLAPSTVDFIGVNPVVVFYENNKVNISVKKFDGSIPGLVPDATNVDGKFLKSDGTWETPTIINNVTYTGSITTGSIAVFNGTAGVVKSTALADLVTQEYITTTLKNYYATENTWRDIQVAGTSIGNKKLNFVPAGSIAIVANPSDLVPGTADTFDVGFDLYWWNLDAGAFEQ